MGLFGSSKSYTQASTTNVITSTSTKIHDVGLTGRQAVEMADILQAGSITHANIQADLMDSMIQQVGGGWNKLIGAAGEHANELVIGSERAGARILAAEETAGARILSTIRDFASELFAVGERREVAQREAGARIMEEQRLSLPLLAGAVEKAERGELAKALPYLAAGAIGLILVIKGFK